MQADHIAGRLDTRFFPNRPGFWAYRRLSDGTMLEAALSSEEWFSLRKLGLRRENAGIRRLNRHPINQAARTCMTNAGILTGPCGALDWIHALSLAAHTLAETQIPACDWSWELLAIYSRGFKNMLAATRRLARELSPDRVAALSPQDAGLMVLEALGVQLEV